MTARMTERLKEQIFGGHPALRHHGGSKFDVKFTSIRIGVVARLDGPILRILYLYDDIPVLEDFITQVPQLAAGDTIEIGGIQGFMAGEIS